MSFKAKFDNKDEYDALASKHNSRLNGILKNKLPAVTTTKALEDIVQEMKTLKLECKNDLINIINNTLLLNYSNFQRNMELQKTTIGLNYTNYHQNVKLGSLAPKNETLQHLKQIIVLNKKQEQQFALVKNYIKVLYNLKPFLIDLSKNFLLLKQKFDYNSFAINTDSELNLDLLLPEFMLIFKTCEIYSFLDLEVRKIFPDLTIYDVLETQFSKKILPSVDIPDEPIHIVKNAHRLLLASISKLFIDSSKQLEQNIRSYKKTDIKYSEVLDVSLKCFPLLNENKTGVEQYIKYVQSIISDSSRDIITSDTQSRNTNNSLFKLLKVTSAIINTHMDILAIYYTDSSWLLTVMEGILAELDVQCGLIVDMGLDSLVRECTGTAKEILELRSQDFEKEFNLESFVSQFFDIIGVWNMFEKFFCFKYNSFIAVKNAATISKPKCLLDCKINIKMAEILRSEGFEGILRANIQQHTNTIFKMEKIPDINRYLNSFEKVDLDHDEVDYPVSSILDDFAIIFKKYLILFINAGNFQIFEEFLQNICLADFISRDFIKTILNKLGELSIITANLSQYLDKEKLLLLQQINSGSTSTPLEQEEKAGKGLFNLQQYTATIFQQQQQAMKIGKDLIINSKQNSSAFVISNNITDDVNMKNFHLLLIYLNTISSLKPVLQQLLVDELLEPEYNTNYEMSGSKTVVEATFVFDDNAKMLAKYILSTVDSANEYINKLIANYTLKIFQIGIRNNLFEFSKTILNSESNRLLDVSYDTAPLPSLSKLGENARGFKFNYVSNAADLTDLSEISEFIKKLELLLQPYENVMLTDVYYTLKLKLCEFLNDFILDKKFFKILKINSLGIIKLEKEVNSVVKAMCLDKKRDLIDYSMKLKFEKILQIIEVLNFDERDFEKIQLQDSDDEQDAEDGFVSCRYVLNKDLKESMEWILTNDEINRIRTMMV